MEELAATGDAPPPSPWQCEVEGITNPRRTYVAAREDGGKISTYNRLDANNASNYIKEHPGTSIVDALVTVIKQRVGLDGLKVVGARVEIDAPHAIDATLSP